MAAETKDYRDYRDKLQVFWDVLLKFNLVIVPPTMALILSWGIWVTQNIMYFQSQESLGNRLTQKDADLSRAAIMQTMSERLSAESSRMRTSLDNGLSRMQAMIQAHIDKDAHPLSKVRADALEASMKRIETRLDRLLEDNHAESHSRQLKQPTG